MKTKGIKLGILLWVTILFQPVFAADYYFSSSTGDDNRSITQAQKQDTPWRSINKLNEVLMTLKPGDNIFLKRGDKFYGTINISSSGTASNPIKIGAYGTGKNPIITSLQTVEQWKSVGNGRNESSNTFNVKSPSVVLINGIIQEQGRYPNRDSKNAGYFVIDKVQSTNTFSTLDPLSSANYTGGEVVIRKAAWVTDRHHVTSHSGNTLKIGNLINSNTAGSYIPNAGWGFFIQNHIETLDVYGEWYFNNQNKRIYMHFGTSGLNNNTVEIATLDHLLTKTFKASFIIVEDLHFNGANKDAIFFDGGSGITLSRLDISNVGQTAINSLAINGIEIKDSKISNALSNGISLRIGNQSAKITNNHIENIGMFQGGMASGDQSGIGISANDNGADILNNKLLNIAYNGINFRRDNILIKNNYINGYCIHKTDGAGVYAYGGASGTEVFKNRVISHNIILNGKGTNMGTVKFSTNSSSSSNPLANGIFLDDNVTNVDIHHNTIAHAANGGITMSNTDQIKVENNIIFDNAVQIAIGNYTRGRDVRNLIIRNNTIVTKEPGQFSYNLVSYKNDLVSFGSFDQNIFSNPLGDDQKIRLNYVKDARQTTEIMDLNRWQTTFKKDYSSNQSIYKVAAFEYIKSIGDPLYNHGSFESNLVGISCSDCKVSKASGKIQGSSLQIVSPAVSTSRIAIGGVTKGKTYVLKFKSRADRTGPLRIFLRYAGSPWQSISNASTIELSTNIQEHTVMIQPTVSVATPVIMFISDIGNWTYWLDDVQINEAEIKITDPEEVFLFDYNNTNTKKSISLTQNYVDAIGKATSGTIEIGSYSSALLIKANKQDEEKPETPPSISIFNLSNNNEPLEGEEINLIVEAASESNTISNIELLVNNKVYTTSKASPSNFVITDMTVGLHKIWARASCDKGLVTSSDTLLFNVKLAVPISVPEDQTESGLKNFFNLGSSQEVTFNNEKYLGEKNSGIIFSQSGIYTNITASKDPLFQTERYGKNINISIPVPNGEYKITTYHNELWFGKSGPSSQPRRRVFDISIEGEKLKENFDLFVHSNNQPTKLAFEGIQVQDGVININLLGIINNATISGISIQGLTTETVIDIPKIEPFKLFLNSGDNKDATFNDLTFLGESNTDIRISGTSGTFRYEQQGINELLHTERHGKDISYNIPVPNGIYTVYTLHNELWFGKNGPSSQQNRRVFDISLEGNVVKSKVDLFIENKNQPTMFEFKTITVSDGVLNLNLKASINNATISGIALFGESDNVLASDANLRRGYREMESLNFNFIDNSVPVDVTKSKIYPNPARDRVTIEIEQENTPQAILIYDTSGKLVNHILHPLEVRTNNTYSIKLEQMNQGVYLVHIVNANQTIIQHKLIVNP